MKLNGMKQTDIYLTHILEEIEFLMKEINELSYEDFIESELYTRAFSRSIEIIGEATKNLPNDFRLSNSNVEWKKLAGIRDKIIHHYFGVDYDIIWDLVTVKLPAVQVKIKNILENK